MVTNPTLEKYRKARPQRSETEARGLWATKAKRADIEPGVFHLHVDARERLEPEIEARLIAIGFTREDFDYDFRIYGKDGDPDKPFQNYNPNAHYTFITKVYADYEEKLEQARAILKDSAVTLYIEGEAILLDYQLTPKELDRAAYNQTLYEVEPGTLNSFISAIDGKTRMSPFMVEKDRLSGKGDEKFRRGEFHFVVRLEETAPEVLEWLANIGCSAPGVPKVIRGEDGELVRDAAGNLMVVTDVVYTLQVLDMEEMLKLANGMVRVINKVGGIGTASMKIEAAIDHVFVNDVDHAKDVPPVIRKVHFGQGYENLSCFMIGNIPFNRANALKELTGGGRLK